MDIKNTIEGFGEQKVELLKKAAQCKSAEELIALAKDYNIVLSEVDAVKLFASMNPKIGKLTDDELDSVAGGDPDYKGGIGAPMKCAKCKKYAADYLRKGEYLWITCKNCGYEYNGLVVDYNKLI